CRKDDPRVNECIDFLRHQDTFDTVIAERALLKKLEGGCQVPIAAYGVIEGDEIHLRGLVGSVDGKELIRDEMRAPRSASIKLGTELGGRILAAGGDKILAEVYQQTDDRPPEV
ncbi:MAG: hydroxymethylbilane synthase, partial [bacterium]|nr:hydroxymethylbilane synthase [bacterium]